MGELRPAQSPLWVRFIISKSVLIASYASFPVSEVNWFILVPEDYQTAFPGGVVCGLKINRLKG